MQKIKEIEFYLSWNQDFNMKVEIIKINLCNAKVSVELSV